MHGPLKILFISPVLNTFLCIFTSRYLLDEKVFLGSDTVFIKYCYEKLCIENTPSTII